MKSIAIIRLEKRPPQGAVIVGSTISAGPSAGPSSTQDQVSDVAGQAVQYNHSNLPQLEWAEEWAIYRFYDDTRGEWVYLNENVQIWHEINARYYH